MIKSILTNYGLKEEIINNLLNKKDYEKLGRVCSVQKHGYSVITNYGFVYGKIKTVDLHHKYDNFNLLPKVGDFVVLLVSQSNIIPNENYFIEYIVRPLNSLVRQINNNLPTKQAIANNIDYAFITVSADKQFNLQKANRMVISCIDTNIIPILVLTKSDLLKSQEKLQELKYFFKDNDITIISTSIINNLGYKKIEKLLKLNKTGVFIGSSGSGKSSLINKLLSEERQQVASVSNYLQKGKHTTTHRELFLLPQGGVIIDTPGMREFALWLEDEMSINDIFSDIVNLSKQCKFSNCTHTVEPNCAVLEALHNGSLLEQRYKEYLKLVEQAVNHQDKIKSNKLINKQYKKKLDKLRVSKKHSNFLDEM